jgi:hypothetical protein
MGSSHQTNAGDVLSTRSAPTCSASQRGPPLHAKRSKPDSQAPERIKAHRSGGCRASGPKDIDLETYTGSPNRTNDLDPCGPMATGMTGPAGHKTVGVA